MELIIRNEIYADGVKQVPQRYPSTGGKNAQVKLGIVRIEDLMDAAGSGESNLLANFTIILNSV